MKLITLVFDCEIGRFFRKLKSYEFETPIKDFDYDNYEMEFSYVPKSTFELGFSARSTRELIHGVPRAIGEMGDLRVVEGKFQGNPKPVVQFELLDNNEYGIKPDVERFMGSIHGTVKTPNLNTYPRGPEYLEYFEWLGAPTILREVEKVDRGGFSRNWHRFPNPNPLRINVTSY
jgi:hypothetical protein